MIVYYVSHTTGDMRVLSSISSSSGSSLIILIGSFPIWTSSLEATLSVLCREIEEGGIEGIKYEYMIRDWRQELLQKSGGIRPSKNIILIISYPSN